MRLHSLGLALYAFGRRGVALPPAAPPPRPEGRLVWINAPVAIDPRPAEALAHRLAEDLGAAVLVTAAGAGRAGPPVWTLPPPPETRAAARAFLAHWRPDAGLLLDGELPALLVDAAQARGIPLAMAEARAPYWPGRRRGWHPGLRQRLLAPMAAVLAADEASARALRRAGAAAAETVGRLEQPSGVLRATEAERAALSRVLGTRPVWLAAALPAEEEAAITAVHRALLRLSHRLLLIVVPDDPARAEPMAARLAQVEGWAIARRSAEEEPDAEVQVFIADTPAEMGLWLRLSPVTYLGGSLTAGGCRADPAPAAALGSAIVHGPRSGAFGAAIGRLAAAQATALVGSADDLVTTLGELLAPDRVARLARAAWTVSTEGAAVNDRIVETVGRMLARGGG
jgi:3-deoxy-D-manno-octulosonic-acid transferase